MKATLLLEDGFTLSGNVFAGEGEVFGEVTFNTAMAGYQETITDPSCLGQISVFTYPHIGNYGCNPGDNESASPRVKAVLVKHYCSKPQNRFSLESLGSFLDRHNTIGIEGIDTRSLTLHLRRRGTMNGVISTIDLNPDKLMEKLNLFCGEKASDPVKQVTTTTPYQWDKNADKPVFEVNPATVKSSEKHVVLLDLGVKYSVLRALADRGCTVTVVPADTEAEDIKALNPAGVFISNGPGDPSELDYITSVIRSLPGWRPLMGIGLGHQLLGRALGMDTFKLPFGHRGVNQPVKETASGRVLITGQNHGFNLSSESKLPAGTIVTHINLNDDTIEGIENKDAGFFSVQFHPETGQGPFHCINQYNKFTEML